VESLIDLRPRVFGPLPPPASRPFRTRAFVSAQEGCNDVCAFCIVPRTRGRERSKDIADVVAEVRAREADGVQEVVITGTQLGAWGREKGAHGIGPLLKALLAETSVPRIRMSSVQPQDLSRDMVSLWDDPRLCRHFHLALQSGSDATLHRMRRRYTREAYRNAVGLLRERIPGVAITTDVIAGFPGETEAEFEETLAFCSEIGFAAMHVFPYSQRLGTAAVKMAEQVPEPIKKERVRRLMMLAAAMSETFRRGFVGSTQSVLWETPVTSTAGRVWEGLTDTYIRVFAESGQDLENRITPVTIEESVEGGVRGKL
jgi:threonylcarbamoyladenosine tRNA methylthiotransferase MtaB